MASLLGVFAIKDLLVFDVPAKLFVPGFRLPWIAGFPSWPNNDVSSAVAFLLLLLAFLASLLLIAGTFARFAAVFLAVLYGVVFLSDQLAYTNNVFLFVVLLLLVAIEPLAPDVPTPAYPIWMGRVLVSVIYVVGTFAKLHVTWLDGTILGKAAFHYHDVWKKALEFDVPIVFQGMALASLVTEAFLAVGFWFERTRRLALVVGVVFHGMIDLILPVRLFSYDMIALFVLFLREEELAVFKAWRASGRASLIFCGVAIALGIDLVFDWFLNVGTVKPRAIVALIMAVFVLFGTRALIGRFSRPDVGGKVLIPERARVPLVAALAAIELFAVVKPAFGLTNRFGWRMFTEVLTLQVSIKGIGADGNPRKVSVPGRWSTDSQKYHWDSLSEQRVQLEGFLEWALSRDSSLKAVEAEVDYVQNRRPGKLLLRRARSSP